MSHERTGTRIERCVITTLPRTGRVCERCTPTLRCGARAAIDRRRSTDEVIELVVEPLPPSASAEGAIPLTRRSSPGRHGVHRRRDPPDRGGLPPIEIERLIRIGWGSADTFYCGLDGSIRNLGLFIATSAPRAVGVEVSLTFVAPGMTAPYSTTGRVSWIREDTHEDLDVVPGMGVALGPLPASVARALEPFLATCDPILYESWLPGDSRS